MFNLGSDTTGFSSFFKTPADNKYSFDTNLKLSVDVGAGNTNSVTFRYVVKAGAAVLDEKIQSFAGGQYYRANQYNLNVPGYNYNITQTYNSVEGDTTPTPTKVFNSLNNSIVDQFETQLQFFEYTVTYTPQSPTYGSKKFKFDPDSDTAYTPNDPVNSSIARTSFSVTVYKIGSTPLYSPQYYITLDLENSTTIRKTNISSGIVNIQSSITDTLLSKDAMPIYSGSASSAKSNITLYIVFRILM